MIIVTDLLIIDHLISVAVLSVNTLSFQTPQLLTILNLKFEQVQFTTHFSVLSSWMSGRQCRP